MDAAFIFYISHVVIDTVGAALMGWWMLKLSRAKKPVSVFYICLFMMFIGGLVSSGESAVCRYFYLIGDHETYRSILGSTTWHLRILINLMADLGATLILLYRFFSLGTRF